METYSTEARATDSPKATAQPGRERLLRRLCFVQLLLLAGEFLIGIVTNLFVTLPNTHPGSNPSNYFVGVVQGVSWALVQGGAALQLHVVFGILLVLAACALVYLAIAARNAGWISIAVAGWIGIVAAGFNGASFLNYGFNFSSLLMSIGFFLALVAYSAGLYRVR